MKSFLLGASRALALLLVISACSKTTLPSSSGGGSGPVGTVDDSAGFYVHLITPTGYTYDIHKASDADGSHNDCVATLGESLLCYAEIQELDLYEKGMSFQINVPSSMCSWVLESPYYYYHYEPGAGHPTVMSYTDQFADVGIDCNQDGTNDGVAERINGTLTGSGYEFCDDDADGNWDRTERTTRDKCIYDYTDAKGPNCCSSRYNRTTVTWSPTAAGYTAPSTTNNIEWGGNRANCIAGPAVQSQPKSESGFPVSFVYPVEGVGLNKLYEVAAPFTMKLGNIYAANFFLETENGNAIPTPMVEPYYRYQCLDPSMDIKAEILVMIREWNTSTEFAARRTTWTPHDLIGKETGNFTAYARNDVWDWLDYYGNGTAYDPLDPAAGGSGLAGAGLIYPRPAKCNYGSCP